MSTVPVLSIADELVAELESIYMAGWDASGEGWNAEYPGDAHDKPEFQLAMRDACAPVLSVILSERAEMQQQLRAAMISVDNCELFRKDAERLDWMIAEQCVMQWQNGTGQPTVYSLAWPQLGEIQAEWHGSPRAAIDAAMQLETKQ